MNNIQSLYIALGIVTLLACYFALTCGVLKAKIARFKRNTPVLSDLHIEQELNKLLFSITTGKLVVLVNGKYRTSFKVNSNNKYVARVSKIESDKTSRFYVEGDPYLQINDNQYIPLYIINANGVKTLSSKDLLIYLKSYIKTTK